MVSVADPEAEMAEPGLEPELMRVWLRRLLLRPLRYLCIILYYQPSKTND
jgi:hypothetical protein